MHCSRLASTGIITLNDAAWTHFLTQVLPTLDVSTGYFDVAVHRAFENYIYLDHFSSVPKDFVLLDKTFRTCSEADWLAGRWDPATQLRPGTASVAWVLMNNNYKGVKPEGNYSQPFEWCDESITLQDHGTLNDRDCDYSRLPFLLLLHLCCFIRSLLICSATFAQFQRAAG